MIACIALSVAGLAMLAIVWTCVCTHRTTQQRQEILTNAVMSSGLLNDLARVDFDRHFWTLFTLGDPRRLYSGRTWRANGWTGR